MLNISNRDDCMTVQIAYFSACAVLFLDIPVCDFSFLLQSVLSSVVKALFDIKSDFLNIDVHMGCYAVIVVIAYQVGVVFLNEPILHALIVGLP